MGEYFKTEFEKDKEQEEFVDKLTDVIIRAAENKSTTEDLKFVNENKDKIKEINDTFELVFGNFLEKFSDKENK